MTIVFIIWGICFIGIIVSSYIRFKLIYLLEENGERISKFAPHLTVYNKISLMMATHQEIVGISPQKLKSLLKAAYILYYVLMATLFLVIIGGIYFLL
jgi:hypothetical protein